MHVPSSLSLQLLVVYRHMNAVSSQVLSHHYHLTQTRNASMCGFQGSGATQAAMAALKLTPSARSFRLGIDHLDFRVSCLPVSPHLCIGSYLARLAGETHRIQQLGLRRTRTAMQEAVCQARAATVSLAGNCCKLMLYGCRSYLRFGIKLGELSLAGEILDPK